MRPTTATKQGKKGQRVLCSTMDGMEGLRDTQEKYPSSDHCKKGVVRQEKITRASSLIPNETFRYQRSL